MLHTRCRLRSEEIPLRPLDALHNGSEGVDLIVARRSSCARIWSTLVTGVIRSKDAAADWVLERLPNEHQPVLTRAREAFLNVTSWEGELWDDLQVRRYGEYVAG